MTDPCTLQEFLNVSQVWVHKIKEINLPVLYELVRMLLTQTHTQFLHHLSRLHFTGPSSY